MHQLCVKIYKFGGGDWGTSNKNVNISWQTLYVDWVLSNLLQAFYFSILNLSQHFDLFYDLEKKSKLN